MNFRDRLREEIDFSGLLDKEVAARADISKRAIDSYVDSRACMPPADVAVRLAQVLDVSVEYLVTGKRQTYTEYFDNENAREIARIYSTLSPGSKKMLLAIARTMQDEDES